MAILLHRGKHDVAIAAELVRLVLEGEAIMLHGGSHEAPVASEHR